MSDELHRLEHDALRRLASIHDDLGAVIVKVAVGNPEAVSMLHAIRAAIREHLDAAGWDDSP